MECKPVTEPDEIARVPNKLRELASWYRAFAERSGNPTIWEARLRTAEDLEAEAARVERGEAQALSTSTSSVSSSAARRRTPSSRIAAPSRSSMRTPLTVSAPRTGTR